MSNKGTFEIQPTSDNTTRQSTVMSDRDPLIKKSPSLEGGIFKGLIQPCLAEFVGVTLFVFLGTVCLNHAEAGISPGLVLVGLTHGFAIVLLVTATASISGGHLNPAVTLGVLLAGGIDFLKAIGYVIAQLLGAILGAALTKGVLTKSVYKAIHGGSHMLPSETSVGQGILCEIVITSVLVTAVLLTAVDEDWKTPNAPLAIGLAVAVGIMAAGDVSGASMNPARSFGPAVVSSSVTSSQWDDHYVYWVGPAVGSVLAALCYRLFLGSPNKLLINY